MAISLGSLVVELKASTAGFIEGMSKASVTSKAFGRELQSGFSKIGELFAPLGAVGEKLAGVFNVVGGSARSALAEIGKSGALVGGLAAATGGAAALGGTMFELASHAAEVGGRIFEASEKTGIAAAQMSGIMALTREAGGGFDALTVSLARAGANLQRAIIEPGEETSKILAQVMGGMKQLKDDGAKPMGEGIQDVLHHIFALNNEGQRNLALSTLLSKGWMANVETLKLLAEHGYGPAEAAARRFGIFFDDNSARQAKQFQVSVKELAGQLAGLGLSLGEKLIPAFTQFMVAMQGMGSNLKALGLRILAIEAAWTGVGIPAAVKMWREADSAGRDATQTMTDMVLRMKNLTKGEEAASEGTGKLTAAVGAQKDALAGLGDHLKDQLAMLDAHGNKTAEAFAGYAKMTGEIQKAAAATGNYAEKLKDQNLAFQILLKNLREAAGTPQINLMDRMPPGFAAGMSTRFGAIQDLPFIPGFGPQRPQTMFAPEVEGTAKQFPGGLADAFQTLTAPLQDQGKDFGAALARDVTSSVDQIEDKFAEMAVKGKANFRDLAQSIEEMFLRSGMQKIISELFTAGQGGVNNVSQATASGGSLAALGRVGGFFTKIFGGFLAGGGDVTPGKTYVVGEDNPEFFTPKVPGTVHRSLPGGTVINQQFHIHGVQDADSFRRSAAQIMGDIHRATSRAVARNG